MAGKSNQDKVAAVRVLNPLASQREVARISGVPKSSVDRIDKQIGHLGAKDPRIISLTDDDFEIQKLIQAKKLEKLKNTPDTISDADINQWDRHSMTRYTTFVGDLTDKDGGLKQISVEEKIAVDQALRENGLV